MQKTTLPFYRGELAKDDEFEPVTISFSRKEVKRCVQALEWFIESFADEMISERIAVEVARYEDLMYRFMGVPDENMKMHAEGRKWDRLGLTVIK